MNLYDLDHVLHCTKFLYFLKFVFARSANGTEPSIWNFIEGRSRRDSTIRVTYCRVINPIANCTFPFFHANPPYALSRFIVTQANFYTLSPESKEFTESAT